MWPPVPCAATQCQRRHGGISQCRNRQNRHRETKGTPPDRVRPAADWSTISCFASETGDGRLHRDLPMRRSSGRSSGAGSFFPRRNRPGGRCPAGATGRDPRQQRFHRRGPRPGETQTAQSSKLGPLERGVRTNRIGTSPLLRACCRMEAGNPIGRKGTPSRRKAKRNEPGGGTANRSRRGMILALRACPRFEKDVPLEGAA